MLKQHPVMDPWAIAPDDLHRIGQRMYALMAELYPICRSITGPGVRQTLSLLQQRVPLEIHEVPSGTTVFDWEVPREWRIRDAYVRDPAGHRRVDFRASNLHVVSYSVPVHRTMNLQDLRAHLFSLPEHPDWIPYRTSYYEENWGFCITHRQLEQLEDQPYEVCIDSSLEDGSLSYGELLLPGEVADEVLLSSHVCHPSLCNDNLSGIAVAVQLAEHLAQGPRFFSYRFLFAPGTIGALTWLSLNRDRLDRIKHGLVLALLGDPGPSTYKKSRRGDADIDRVVAHVLRHSGQDFSIREFSPDGYDERQFCSPGIDLPVGCLMRSPSNEYPEYHTSADNPDLVDPEYLADSWAKCLRIVHGLERNKAYRNLSPFGEPQLGRRGVYAEMQESDAPEELAQALRWVLNLSDGKHSLLEIAERSGLPFSRLEEAAGLLTRRGLLGEAAWADELEGT